MTDSKIRADIKSVFSVISFPFVEKWTELMESRGYMVFCSSAKLYSYKEIEDVFKRLSLPEHLKILQEEYRKKEKKFMAEHPEFAKSTNYIPDFSDDSEPRYSMWRGKVMRKRNGQKIKPYIKRVAVLNRKISKNETCVSDTVVKARGKR